MKNILITTSSFGSNEQAPSALLNSHGFTTIINPFGRKLTEQELSVLLLQYKPTGLIAGVEPITAQVLQKSADFLKVISRVGVGWDNIDHNTAKELGIKIYRTEGVLDQSVAEFTLGFILNALRNIALQDREIRQGKWHKSMGSLLQNKTIGIIGFGAIGQKVGQLCMAFGAEVIFTDPCRKDTTCGICVELAQLLERSDIISIHASGCDRILCKNELEQCKNGVILINTARGGLIDEDHLLQALTSGHVRHACLDVFALEPYTGPLARLNNVTLTPHIGSYAREARIRMEEMAVNNLLAGLGLTP